MEENSSLGDSKKNIKYSSFIPYCNALVKDERFRGHINREELLEYIENVSLFFCENNLDIAFRNTKNKVYARNIPFREIFIDQEIKFEDWTMEGINVGYIDKPLGEPPLDPQELRRHNIYSVMIVEYLLIQNYNPKDYAAGSSFKIQFRRLRVDSSGTELLFQITPPTESEKKQVIKIDNFVLNWVCNFIDFIEQPGITIIKQPRDNLQNQKRIQRGKMPHPQTNIIRLSPEHIHYLKKLEQHSKLSYSHKFMVRGHWMNFHHPRYKAIRTWVKPYFKGEGLLIKSKYLLTETKPKDEN
jgi:hypothetical protein